MSHDRGCFRCSEDPPYHQCRNPECPKKQKVGGPVVNPHPMLFNPSFAGFAPLVPRTDWDDRFICLAEHVATWSKDPSTRVGAVVVARDDRRKISHGYNGFPPGITDDDRLATREVKYKITMHAERNALDNATFDVAGATIYCPLPPCLECAKSIMSRRLVRVVTRPHPTPEAGRWTAEIPEALALLSEARIEMVVIPRRT